MEPLDRPASLAARVAKNLREELKRAYVVGGQLPSEPELAAQFCVSRGTVRQALTILEREGIIFRRQGAGTYVHKYALRIQTRAEHAIESSELLRLAGFEPSIQLVSFDRHLPLPKDIAAHLDIEPGTPALVVRKLFLANGQPAIYCLDFVPESIICQDFRDEELKQPIFDFMKQHCGQSTWMNLAEIIPEVADKELGQLLAMKPGQPLLRMDEVCYNDDSHPVLFAHVYYKDQFVRFSLLRKRM